VTLSFEEPERDRLAAAWQPVDDWTTLAGSFVEFHHQGRLLDAGTVEAVTPDGEVLWLSLEGSLPRRIIQKEPNVFARLLSSGPFNI